MLTAEKRRRMNRLAKRKAKLASMTKEAVLSSFANRLLRKDGAYPKRESRDEVSVEAEAITTHGGLRATWTGRP